MTLVFVRFKYFPFLQIFSLFKYNDISTSFENIFLFEISFCVHAVFVFLYF